MKKAVIKSAIAPIMSEPDFSSVLADEALHGMVVSVSEEYVRGFYKIKTHYNYSGYVHELNLDFDEGAVEIWLDSFINIINHYAVDVLSKPEVRGSHIITLTKGCSIIALSEDDGGFTKVLTAQGREGYVRTKFLNPPIPFFDLVNYTEDEENIFRENVVNTAMEFMTSQYRWGGKTPLGIDCSGLCSIAYLLNGVAIYRDASIKEGFPVKEIAFKDLKKGDLVFFPGHVAMYLEDGKYIHASASNDGVYINSFIQSDADYREDLEKSVTKSGTIFKK